MQKRKIQGRFIFAVIFVLLVLSRAQAFVFVSLADSRGNDTGVNSGILSRIVQQVAGDSPAFIVFSGDLIAGNPDNEIVKLQYNRWRKVMEPVLSRIPVYVIPGNHEINGPGQNRIFQEVFEMPENGPEGYEELCYSFDYENCHFVCLDTNYYGKFHRLGQLQYDWLKHDLAKTDREHIFVFGHEPAYPVGPHKGNSLDVYIQERDRFWNLLKEYKVKAYFCGHEHLYNRQLIDGVYQVINGTCGAPIHRGYGGEFYHYALVSIIREKIEIVIKNENGAEKDRFFITGEAR